MTGWPQLMRLYVGLRCSSGVGLTLESLPLTYFLTSIGHSRRGPPALSFWSL